MIEMNDRLALFMRSEQLTAAKLAEIVQVQPSSISHLLSGRNKPNFEFVSRLMRMFPELSPDWLINGIGTMYRHQNAQKEHQELEGVQIPQCSPNLFDDQKKSSLNQSVPSGVSIDTNVIIQPEALRSNDGFEAHIEDQTAEAEAISVTPSPEIAPGQAQATPKPIDTISATQEAPTGVRQVVVLFDDQTCVVYQTRPTTQP